MYLVAMIFGAVFFGIAGYCIYKIYQREKCLVCGKIWPFCKCA